MRKSQRLRGAPKGTETKTQEEEKKKSRKKEKKASPAKQQSTETNPVRCCICMEWCEAPDEEVYSGSVWTCIQCRTMPAILKEIQKQLSALSQTNSDLVLSLAGKVAEADELRKENQELRTLLKTQPLNRGNGRHLIVGDFSLQHISSDDQKLEIIHSDEMDYQDCSEILTSQAKSEYDQITIVVGANDCKHVRSVAEMSHDLTKIIHQAKTITRDKAVTVSSIIPYMYDETIQDLITEMNACAKSLCKTNGVKFITNDPIFMLASGEVNEGFLDESGLKPNTAGSSKLVKNLYIDDKVKINKQEAWEKVRDRKQKTTVNTKPLSNTKKTQIDYPKPSNSANPNTKKTQIDYPKPNNSANPRRAPCWNCGESGHTSNICIYRIRLTCRKCGKQGHKSSLCKQH